MNGYMFIKWIYIRYYLQECLYTKHIKKTSSFFVNNVLISKIAKGEIFNSVKGRRSMFCLVGDCAAEGRTQMLLLSLYLLPDSGLYHG